MAFSWCVNRGDPNYLQVLRWSSNQVIQCDLLIPQLEVTNNPWRGHVSTIPKRSPAELPGRYLFSDKKSGKPTLWTSWGFSLGVALRLLVECQESWRVEFSRKTQGEKWSNHDREPGEMRLFPRKKGGEMDGFGFICFYVHFFWIKKQEMINEIN